MPFSVKRLKVEITMYDGVGFNGGTTLIFDDFPMSVKITKTGFPSAPEATVSIFGVSKSHMEAITTIAWRTTFINQKKIRIFADDGKGYSLLFDGGIWEAVPNYQSAPDISIQIKASMVAFPNNEEVPPFSQKGNVAVSDVMNGICEQYGIRCVNRGVLGICENPRFDQRGFSARITAAARKYDIEAIMLNNRVEIAPKGAGRQSFTLTSGSYIGYPTFSVSGISLNIDKILDIEPTDTFTVKGSDVELANDKWILTKIMYDLNTQTSGGRWNVGLQGVRISVLTGGANG